MLITFLFSRIGIVIMRSRGRASLSSRRLSLLSALFKGYEAYRHGLGLEIVKPGADLSGCIDDLYEFALRFLPSASSRYRSKFPKRL